MSAVIVESVNSFGVVRTKKKLMCTFRVKAPFSNSFGIDWMEPTWPKLNNNLTRSSMVIKIRACPL